jgi:hypothetical protein
VLITICLGKYNAPQAPKGRIFDISTKEQSRTNHINKARLDRVLPHHICWVIFFQHERREGEGDRAREQMSKYLGLSPPKTLGSIYKRGGEGYLYFILSVG